MLKSKMSTRDQFNPTQRFSSRVSDYVKYRPGYPPQVVGWLSARCGLTPASVIADVGSGTGLLRTVGSMQIPVSDIKNVRRSRWISINTT